MIRAIWCAIGFALAVCILMCAIRDEQGDEQDAWAWAGACIGLAIVAFALYAWEYTPTRGRAILPEPTPTARERTVYDRQPLDTMD